MIEEVFFKKIYIYVILGRAKDICHVSLDMDVTLKGETLE